MFKVNDNVMVTESFNGRVLGSVFGEIVRIDSNGVIVIATEFAAEYAIDTRNPSVAIELDGPIDDGEAAAAMFEASAYRYR